MSQAPAKYRVTQNGEPVSFGKVYWYKKGTSRLEDTFYDYLLTSKNTNPVILDANGEADVYLSTKLYREEVYSSDGSLVRIRDGVSGDTLTLGAADSRYVLSGTTTFQNAITRDVIANVRTYTCTNQSISAYTSGVVIGIVPDAALSTDTSYYININGLGDRRIYSAIGGTPSFSPGTQYSLYYDGTNFIVATSTVLLAGQPSIDIVQEGISEKTILKAIASAGTAELTATYGGGDATIKINAPSIEVVTSAQDQFTANGFQVVTLGADGKISNAYMPAIGVSGNVVLADQIGEYTLGNGIEIVDKLSVQSELELLGQGLVDFGVYARNAVGYGHVNKIINGCFRINQRAVSGTVTLSAGAYGHDRWKAGAGGCTYTFSSSGNVVTITITAGTLVQVIEGANLFAGTHILEWEGTATARIDSGSYGSSGLQASASGGSNQSVEFSTGTVSKVRYVQGTSATSFEPRLLSCELALCRSYFQKSTGLGDYSSWQGYVANSTSFRQSEVYFPVEMRASPTVTLTGKTNGGPISALTGVVTSAPGGFREQRAGSGAGDAYWTSEWTASAEL